MADSLGGARGGSLGVLCAPGGEQQDDAGDDPVQRVGLLEDRRIAAVAFADRDDGEQQECSGAEQRDDDTLPVGRLSIIGVEDAEAEDLVILVLRCIDVGHVRREIRRHALSPRPRARVAIVPIHGFAQLPHICRLLAFIP
jgi:hypothetical protein